MIITKKNKNHNFCIQEVGFDLYMSFTALKHRENKQKEKQITTV